MILGKGSTVKLTVQYKSNEIQICEMAMFVFTSKKIHCSEKLFNRRFKKRVTKFGGFTFALQIYFPME